MPVAEVTPAEAMQKFADLFRAQSSSLGTVLWHGAGEALTPVLQNVWEGLKTFCNPSSVEDWQKLLAPYQELGLLTAQDVAALTKFRTATWPLNAIFFIQVFTRLLEAQFTAVTTPAQERILQDGLNATRPTLPPYAAAIQAAFIAPEKSAEVRAYLGRLGFSEKVIDLMFLANYKLYDEISVMTLYWRGILDETKVYERMRELGYTDTRIKELTAAWSLIPPVQDILTMVAKEAFEPDSILKLGLDDEFPEEQSEWLAKQGLSPYWQHKYWMAHWEQPSIGMGYEMLQRGIIDRADLEFLFRTVEIPRYWRDKLLKIAYTPYTRVDSRRMHKVGVLTDEELIHAYTDIGYDVEHATKMAEFTKRANRAAEKDLSKSEVMTGYTDRLITREQAATFLVKLGYDQDEATYILALTDYKEKAATAKLLQSNIETRFKNRLIDKAEAKRLLDGLNLPAAQSEALLSKWEAIIIPDEKMPGMPDLTKFLQSGIISFDTYRIEMRRLGYSAQYTDWYEKLAVAQSVSPVKKT